MNKKLPRIYTETLRSGESFEMVLVEGGSFKMGGANEEENPIHLVNLKSFYLGKIPVNSKLWFSVLRKLYPSKNKDLYPIVNITLKDIIYFLSRLRVEIKKEYRLPSESEWEFAARGGLFSENYLYAGSDKLKEVGWYSANSRMVYHPLGLKLPNELGIHDMSGNVWEWVEDHWHPDYQNAPNDGSSWVNLNLKKIGEQYDRSRRVLRGGSWGNGASDCRVSSRTLASSSVKRGDIGFRLALSLD